jgi:hypothetical protein
MKVFKKFIIVIRHLNVAMFLLKFMYRGYLYDVGWIESRKAGTCVDRNGAPLPWITYPFIKFLEGRLNKTMRVFEYGSGNSTLFYAKSVAQVISVEGDAKWYNYVSSRIPKNVILQLEKDDASRYVTSIRKFNQSFDIIIVDGRHRVNCVKESINFLSEKGVIVLDNSDRPKYRGGIDFLLKEGFKRIDFWGMAPSAPNSTCTSLFYRRDNILDV